MIVKMICLTDTDNLRHNRTNSDCPLIGFLMKYAIIKASAMTTRLIGAEARYQLLISKGRH